MYCVQCGQPAKPRSKYCEKGACRSQAWRNRHGKNGPVGRPPKDRGSEPANLDATAGKDRKLLIDGLKGTAARPERPGQISKRRIGFDRQLLPYAPPRAAGYRLIGMDMQTGAVLALPEGMLYWKLAPFQPPDSPQLREGARLRVLWIGAQGEEIPPENTGTIPILGFFRKRWRL
jgi:hypothetical protein